MRAHIGAALTMLCLSVEAQPTCFFEKNGAATLHGEGNKASVLVTNVPCPIAHVEVSIKDKRGKFLYSFKEELSVLMQGLDGPKAPYEAEALAKSILTSFLNPSWPLSECRLVVTSQYFEKLKASKRPLLWQQTYYEGGKYFAYVPELGQSIDVAYCGS